MTLEKINSPQDLKNLEFDELKTLADEIRQAIIKKVNITGGHMAPNLGIVETTIAFHKVFNSPKDKIVFDVSHQCYPHKILTGRKDGFLEEENYYKYTGYLAPEESEHDTFKIGHTSTSVSLATGIAKARDLKGEKHNVIALIGDGSLSGGEAYEGLNNASVLNSNIIIIVNDNEMSIAENQGGLYKNLRFLRETQGKAECNFFKALGFDYHYLEEGNNIEKLIELFSKVKDTPRPTVLHIHTLKGCGLPLAEANKECFHWILPHTLDNFNKPTQAYEDYTSITADYILEKAKTDKTIVAITAATPGVHGFTKEFREKMGSQFVDVGIAEEHAVAYASAIAKNGGKPIFAVMSSFVQRTYDQISQDLCLNNSPITMLVYWGGLSGADSTHLCSFDMAMLGNIPNLVYLAPTNKEEHLAMLEWSLNQTEHPVAIRIPNCELTSCSVADLTNYSVLNKYQVTEQGESVAILGLGTYYHKAKNFKDYLREKTGINATLINPKFITGLDEELLNSLKTNHKLVITLEDGCLDGGFGEKIARFYGKTDVKVLNFGGKKEFTESIPMNILEQRYHLTNELIFENVQEVLKVSVK